MPAAEGPVGSNCSDRASSGNTAGSAPRVPRRVRDRPGPLAGPRPPLRRLDDRAEVDEPEGRCLVGVRVGRRDLHLLFSKIRGFFFIFFIFFASFVEGSISYVSKPVFASKFCSLFQVLQDLRTFALFQTIQALEASLPLEASLTIVL